MRAILFNNFLVLFIFLSLIAAFGITSTGINYFLFVGFLGFWLLFVLAGMKLKVTFIWFDLVPAAFLVIWAYGVIVGVLLGNKPIFIISNFAGMVLYVVYFVLVLAKIKPEILVKTVLFAAIIHALYSYGKTLSVLYSGRTYLSSVRMYYSPGLSVIGPAIASSLMTLSLVRGLGRNTKIKAFGLLIFLFIPYAILSFSKGYFASIVMLIGLVSLVSIIASMQSLRIKRTGLVFLIFVLTSTILTLYNFGDELRFLYSVEEASNFVRDGQSSFIIREINFWGNGLGAILESGFVRNDNQPYGFELNFLSILHKFGYFGFIIFTAYAFCVVIPLRTIFFKKVCHHSWLAIGGMLFLVPGYGNPLLFHPTIVILHCVVMYWIRCSILEKEAKKYV